MKTIGVKKTILLLLLVSLLALATAMPVLAGRGKGTGSGRRGQQSVSLVGTITAIDGSTFTVQSLNYRFAGQVITVQTTSNTAVFAWTVDGRVPITFGDIDVGDSANIKGAMIDEVFTASSVIVDVPLYCQQ